MPLPTLRASKNSWQPVLRLFVGYLKLLVWAHYKGVAESFVVPTCASRSGTEALGTVETPCR